jgi:hypothetical protein
VVGADHGVKGGLIPVRTSRFGVAERVSLPDVCVFEGAGGAEPEVALPSFAAEDVGVTGGERESGVVEAEHDIVKED